LSFKFQNDFISLNQTITPFTSKKHILFISKPIGMILAALNALNVELQKKNETQIQKKTMTKDLELQIANWFIILNQTMTPSPQKNILYRIQNQLKLFCDFECAMCRTTKYF